MPEVLLYDETIAWAVWCGDVAAPHRPISPLLVGAGGRGEVKRWHYRASPYMSKEKRVSPGKHMTTLTKL